MQHNAVDSQLAAVSMLIEHCLLYPTMDCYLELHRFLYKIISTVGFAGATAELDSLYRIASLAPSLSSVKSYTPGPERYQFLEDAATAVISHIGFAQIINFPDQVRRWGKHMVFAITVRRYVKQEFGGTSLLYRELVRTISDSKVYVDNVTRTWLVWLENATRFGRTYTSIDAVTDLLCRFNLSDYGADAMKVVIAYCWLNPAVRDRFLVDIWRQFGPGAEARRILVGQWLSKFVSNPLIDTDFHSFLTELTRSWGLLRPGDIRVRERLQKLNIHFTLNYPDTIKPPPITAQEVDRAFAIDLRSQDEFPSVENPFNFHGQSLWKSYEDEMRTGGPHNSNATPFSYSFLDKVPDSGRKIRFDDDQILL